jgi:predicted transposase YdaD
VVASLYNRIIKEEGILEGRKEGERNKAIEVVKNMLREGLDTRVIVRVTGVRRNEIEEIRHKYERQVL